VAGAGPSLALRLLTAFGEQHERIISMASVHTGVLCVELHQTFALQFEPYQSDQVKTWNGFGDPVGQSNVQINRHSVIIILAPFFTSSSRGCATVMWEGLNGKGSHETTIKSS
jgi:hypothetical protein